MNKKYKEAISQIQISEELERKILSMSINKKEKRMRLSKLANSLLIFGIVLSTGFIVIFAKDIVSFVTSSFTIDDGTVIESEEIGPVKINEDAPLMQKKMTFSEAEKILGIDLLTSDIADHENVHYNTWYENDIIGVVMIDQNNFVDYSKLVDEGSRKSVTLGLTFYTTVATPSLVNEFSLTMSWIDAELLEETYVIKSVDAKVIFILTHTYDYDNWAGEGPLAEMDIINARFVYNNVQYNCSFIGHTMEEVKAILDTIK